MSASELNIKEIKTINKDEREICRVVFSDNVTVYKDLKSDVVYPKDISDKYINLIYEYETQDTNSGLIRSEIDPKTFWEDLEDCSNDKKSKKRVSDKAAERIIAICCVAIFSGMLGLAWFSAQGEKVEQEKAENLQTCLTNAETKYPNITEEEKQNYGTATTDEKVNLLERVINNEDLRLSCYNEYGTEDNNKQIENLTQHQAALKLDRCLIQASTDYSITNEEMQTTNLNLQLVLVKRKGAGIDAAINCNNKYKTDEYDSNIEQLEAEKKENASWVTYVENAIQLEQSKTKTTYDTSTHCSSRSIGGTIHTNCY